MWLFDLSDEFNFTITKNEVEFDHGVNISDHIDLLLDSFAKWEKSNLGK